MADWTFMQKLTKKYGLITVSAMVVGIVIGSGVFYNAQDILVKNVLQKMFL